MESKMELRVFRSNSSQECYLAGEEDKPYLFWDYYHHLWDYGIGETWSKKFAHWQPRETSWLEILVMTGTTKEQAEKIWRKKFPIIGEEQ